MTVAFLCAQRGCGLPKQECTKHHTLPIKTNEERAFYQSSRWRRVSLRHREQEPLCRTCKKDGRIVIGALTDHIIPIRQGGQRWDEANYQTLCDACHQRKRRGEVVS